MNAHHVSIGGDNGTGGRIVASSIDVPTVTCECPVAVSVLPYQLSSSVFHMA
jgi:hypothetical protein